MNKKILLIGESLIDLISGNYVKSVKDADSFTPHLGGSPFNIATMLGDLGFKPFFLTRIGDDPFGYLIVRELESRGVDTTYVQMDPYSHTSMVLIAKSKENHDFLPLRDADYKLVLPDESIIDNLLKRVDIIHFSSWPISRLPSRHTLENILIKAKKYDIKICFDINYRRKLLNTNFDAISYIKKLLRDIYMVKPSVEDAYEIFGEKRNDEYIDMFHHFGVKYVVLTLGKKGALVSDGKKIQTLPSLAKHPVDSTGAGDGFWAGLYYGIRLGYDIFKSAEIGSIIAAFKTDSKSPSERLPSLERLKNMYKVKENL